MITRLTTVSELKQIFAETLLNNTSKVNKVSDNSVVNGVAFGVAKIAQKAIKDIALVESHTLVDSAYGNQLDDIALSRGIAARFGSSQSTTYVRVVGAVGTVYTAGAQTFSGRSGITFDVQKTITIGPNGFAYVPVRSQAAGDVANVDPLDLDTVDPVPPGHSYCVNEYAAFGGRDTEQDDVFKKRIKEGVNLAATSTISKLIQVFMKINTNVLRVFYQGTNSRGQVVLAIATQNGIDLTAPELNNIEVRASEYLAISDLRPFGTTSSLIELKNIEYQPVDITFRVELQPSFSADDVRREVQVRFSKYLDFRFWTPDQKVEWDELLSIVKNTPGVKSVPDTKFIPNSDVTIDKNKLPRIRSFMMLDLSGNIISNVSGTLDPVFYPNNPDSSFQQTILKSI